MLFVVLPSGKFGLAVRRMPEPKEVLGSNLFDSKNNYCLHFNFYSKMLRNVLSNEKILKLIEVFFIFVIYNIKFILTICFN